MRKQTFPPTIKPDFTEEHFKNRLQTYRDRTKTAIKNFKENGYPANLAEATHFYAVYRELGLSFMLPFDDWEVLWNEKRE